MMIKDLKPRPNIKENTKLNNAYVQFEKLLDELRNKELSHEIVDFLNVNINEVNVISEEKLKSEIKKKQCKITKRLEKELKIVPKNYYRNMWLAIGMAVFGIPLGVAFGASFGNMAFIAMGLPLGMVIGIAVGTTMDKKAFDEGRQLDIVLK